MNRDLSTKRILASAALVGSVLGAACAQPAAPEATGEAKQALNDTTCLPAAVSDFRLGTPASRCFNKAKWGTTDPNRCPDQSVYEMDSSGGWWWPYVAPIDPITTEGECLLYSASTSVTATSRAGLPVDLGTKVTPFKWDARTGTCEYADMNQYDHLPGGPAPDGISVTLYPSIVVTGEIFWTNKGVGYSRPSKVTLQCIDI